MNIVYYKQAVKALKNMDMVTKDRIKNAIVLIPRGDIKKLQGHNELYRLRVSDWRIVFSYPDSETILIEKIAPRGEVYRGI